MREPAIAALASVGSFKAASKTFETSLFMVRFYQMAGGRRGLLNPANDSPISRKQGNTTPRQATTVCADWPLHRGLRQYEIAPR
jgi:hypothetical protein